jgi:hypothetical protein
MLQVRFNLLTADPLRLGDAIKYVEAEVRPLAESLRGSLGQALYANPELGVAVIESFWASDEAVVQSGLIVGPGRSEAVRRAAGTICVERYQVPVFEQHGAPMAGGGLRLTRMDIEPSRLPDAIEAYGDTAVPQLADAAGFCAALLFVDQNLGRLISETLWDTPQALAASRSAAAGLRVEAVESAGGAVRAVEEYGLVFNSARKP